MIARVQRFLVRPDPSYDAWVASHQSRTRRAQWVVVGLHLLPGLFGLVSVKLLVPWLHAATSVGHHWLQLVTLGTMAIGWELAMPFVWLRRDGLSFRQSLDFLGFRSIDLKGLLIVGPLLLLALTVLGGPYLLWGYEPVRAWLDRWAPIHMPPWHILYYGYYNFPALPLAIVVIGNFLGEEVYFRGYLLKRLGFLGPRAWLASNFLFLSYHLWQAPVNWAYLPIFFLIPFGQAMSWRKSIWVPVAIHVALNLGVVEWLLSMFAP
ncbi:MAG: CPBP family intramembrane glutamic endopeptidase [Gemmatimonadales bacterium]|nr:CPBP family intramembrane glutamic endopeptidase [Gemmatimonadales bacterium]